MGEKKFVNVRDEEGKSLMEREIAERPENCEECGKELTHPMVQHKGKWLCDECYEEEK